MVLGQFQIGADTKADRHAADVLPIIEDIRDKGITTLLAIAAELNERQILTARGGKWHPTSWAIEDPREFFRKLSGQIALACGLLAILWLVVVGEHRGWW